MSKPPPQFHFVTYDLKGLVAFFRSAAMAKSLAANTRAEWKQSHMGGAIDFMYDYVFSERVRPGAMVVQQDWQKVKMEMGSITQQYIDQFLLRAANGGGAAAGQYLRQINAQRQMALDMVNGLLDASREVNAEVADLAKTTARRIATVQFTCAVMATGITFALGGPITAGVLRLGATRVGAKLGAGALGRRLTQDVATAAAHKVGMAAFGTGSAVGGSLIKDQAELAITSEPFELSLTQGTGKAIAIETGKNGIEATKSYFENRLATMRKSVSDHDQAFMLARQKVEHFNAQLGTKISGSARKNAQKQIKSGLAQAGHAAAQSSAAAGKLAAEQAAQNGSKLVRLANGAAHYLPFISVGVELYDSISDAYGAYTTTQ